MSKQYTYPSDRVVSAAGAIVLVRFVVDFPNQKFQLAFREINDAGTIVSSPMVSFDDLDKPNLMINVADTLPGNTFEEKLLSQQAIRNFLPWVPVGGTVEDV